MGKFKVGDRVMIRYWDDMEAEFGMADGRLNTGSAIFNSGMKHLSGRQATIKSVEMNRVFLKDWSDVSGDMGWCFTLGMLVLVKSAPPAKKMTIAEVEKALGYEIELVSEK